MTEAEPAFQPGVGPAATGACGPAEDPPSAVGPRPRRPRRTRRRRRRRRDVGGSAVRGHRGDRIAVGLRRAGHRPVLELVDVASVPGAVEGGVLEPAVDRLPVGDVGDRAGAASRPAATVAGVLAGRVPGGGQAAPSSRSCGRRRR